MAGKDLQEAAARAANRRKLLKTPVIMKKDAPENIGLSKAEFIAKRRAEKEEELAVEQFKAERRAKAPEEKKTGRPKKVKED